MFLRNISCEGRKQDKGREELNCDAVTAEASVGPVESSGTEIAFKSGPQMEPRTRLLYPIMDLVKDSGCL